MHTMISVMYHLNIIISVPINIYTTTLHYLFHDVKSKFNEYNGRCLCSKEQLDAFTNKVKSYFGWLLCTSNDVNTDTKMGTEISWY